MKIYQHFKTITYHKWLVMKGCFSIGLFKQGICHDLSKYSPTEFWVGAKFFQGDRSPNNAEREEKGYSSSWLHHKGRNRHHYEYWIDYSIKDIKGGMVPAPMPIKYILEMVMDRIAASKVYAKDAFTRHHPLAYYNSGKEFAPLHKKTKDTLELFLLILDKYGEKEMARFMRKKVIPNEKLWDDKEKWPLLIKKYRKLYDLDSLDN